ncbi:MAG: hypothetical protein OK454_06505 [Thaumarchaeota archaeon]|nr:hypothetical protein [Nitrososphaerota archaeon]
MKKRIAEAEAKKRASRVSSGSQTPNNASSSTPAETRDGDSVKLAVPPVLSSGGGDHADEPLGRLISESTSLKLPKRSERQGDLSLSRRERRERISSLDLPRLEASLLEKASKLRLWKHKVAQLQAELDESMAEKRCLTEEMAALMADEAQNPSPRKEDAEDEQMPEASPVDDPTPSEPPATQDQDITRTAEESDQAQSQAEESDAELGQSEGQIDEASQPDVVASAPVGDTADPAPGLTEAPPTDARPAVALETVGDSTWMGIGMDMSTSGNGEGQAVADGATAATCAETNDEGSDSYEPEVTMRDSTPEAASNAPQQEPELRNDGMETAALPTEISQATDKAYTRAVDKGDTHGEVHIL